MFLDTPVLKQLYEVFMTGKLQQFNFPFYPGVFLVQVLSNTPHPMEEDVPTVRILGR